MKFLKLPTRPIALGAQNGHEPTWHVFTKSQVDAINAALAARRPLLVRGEPGTGKSQLARAAAQELERAFLLKTIDARTEARDLMWTFDAVARLAEAQIQGVLKASAEAVRDALAEEKFVAPGPLWWAFDWSGAKIQAEKARQPLPAGDTPNGAVLLIDEIDKADSAVPNALLEALGAGRFPGPGDQVVVCGPTPPLTIITTNEERALPDAFLRRCLVLHLAWPKDEGELKKDLVIWGRAHFAKASQDLLEKAADLLIIDRRAVAGRGLNPPGGAEYLDLLRAVLNQVDDPAGQKALLDVIAGFALRKHPQEGAD